MAQSTAVVLDKNQSRREDIRIRLSHCGILPICFNDEWICLENIHHIRPAFAVIRSDSRDMTVRFVNLAKAIQRSFPVIVLSKQKKIERFVRNIGLVNLFFLRDPANDQDFQRAIAFMAQSKPNLCRPVVIAGSPESQERIARLPLLGMSPEPVLIQGEPGVGKRLMARAIYSCSAAETSDLKFIKARDISGRWIRQTHQRVDAPVGAAGNILACVIENIENLSIDLQSQLLLIMEKPAANQKINGGGQAVRFITLAETDLERLSRAGRFRKDLYHRLSVLKMTLPPLRDRREDITALADFFVARHSIHNGGAFFRLTDEVRTVLNGHPWPGNVAELKGTIRRLLAGEVTDWTENLSTWCGNQARTQERQAGAGTMDVNTDMRRFLVNNRELSLKQATQRYAMQVEIQIIKAALSTTNGNCKKAAGLLDISYKSMLNKVKEYRLAKNSVIR